MAKLTLEHIKGNTYYIPLPTIVGYMYMLIMQF